MLEVEFLAAFDREVDILNFVFHSNSFKILFMRKYSYMHKYGQAQNVIWGVWILLAEDDNVVKDVTGSPTLRFEDDDVIENALDPSRLIAVQDDGVIRTSLDSSLPEVTQDDVYFLTQRMVRYVCWVNAAGSVSGYGVKYDFGSV